MHEETDIEPTQLNKYIYTTHPSTRTCAPLQFLSTSDAPDGSFFGGARFESALTPATSADSAASGRSTIFSDSCSLNGDFNKCFRR